MHTTEIKFGLHSQKKLSEKPQLRVQGIKVAIAPSRKASFQPIFSYVAPKLDFLKCILLPCINRSFGISKKKA